MSVPLTNGHADPTWHPSCPETGTTNGALPWRLSRNWASSQSLAVTMVRYMASRSSLVRPSASWRLVAARFVCVATHPPRFSSGARPADSSIGPPRGIRPVRSASGWVGSVPVVSRRYPVRAAPTRRRDAARGPDRMNDTEHRTGTVPAGSTDRLESILESMPAGFIAVDREFRLTYLNRHAEVLFEYAREEVLGKSIWEVVPEVRGGELYRAGVEGMDGRGLVCVELYDERKSEWYEIHAFPVDDGMAVYFTNVTARK